MGRSTVSQLATCLGKHVNRMIVSLLRERERPSSYPEREPTETCSHTTLSDGTPEKLSVQAIARIKGEEPVAFKSLGMPV